MNGIALSESAPVSLASPGAGRRWYVWPSLSLAVLILLALSWWAWRVKGDGGAAIAAGKFFTITPTDLDIRIRKDGELQAVNNIDVINKVEGRQTIVYLAKEGEAVRKGDLLVELDSSTIRQQFDADTLAVKQAESDLKNSQEMLEIQKNQNQADLEAAEVELELAKLALLQYEDGTYPQELADAQTLVKMTEITVRNKEEDLEQTKSLFAKGFVTAADVKQAELSVTTVHNELRKAQTALKVLTTYKHPTDLATARSALSQAEQKVARVKRTNASMLAKATADVETKEMALATKTRDLAEEQEQLENCKIYAPSDGMVVYDRSDDDFRMVEGAQVRERQRLIRLPDVSHMKAVMKINESQVPRLRVGQRALVRVVGVPEPVGATVIRISPMADGSSRWWNPEVREYPVELVVDRTTPEMKPGLTLQGEIFVEQLRDVTAVPLASIYSQGRDSYVFVRRGQDVEPVKVQIGGASETHAHLTHGVSVGQDVLVLSAGQGRTLLERAGIETTNPFERESVQPPDAPPVAVTRAQAEANSNAGREKQKDDADARAGAPADNKLATPAPRQGGGRNRGQGDRGAGPRGSAGQSSTASPSPAAVVAPKPAP